MTPTNQKVARKRGRPSPRKGGYVNGSFKFMPMSKARSASSKSKPPSLKPPKAGPALPAPPTPATMPTDEEHRITVPCPQLGEGWMQQIVKRKTVSSTKKWDRKFITPEGEKLRGMPEVNRYFNREERPRKNCWINNVFKPPAEMKFEIREARRAEVEAAKAAKKAAEKEAAEDLKMSLESKYDVGDPVTKMFYDDNLGKERPFQGEIMGYDAKVKLYSVVYEDGDEEELNETDVEKMAHDSSVLWARAKNANLK